MKVINFGSLNLDFVYNVDRFVRPGETISSLSRNVFCGGKGLNQSIALARSGIEVFHAGAIGKSDGARLIEILKENNINTDYIIEYDDEPTGHAIIQVDDKGQNCILLYGGTNQMITKEHVDRTLENFSRGDFILLQNEINQLSYIMEKANEKGMKIVLNPSPIDKNILDLPLEYVEYFLLNEIEAADISGVNKDVDMLESLNKKYPKAKIIMTLGEKGSYYKDSKEEFYQDIYETKVVDTTGAGDTFTGYFIGSLVKGMTVKESLNQASLASAISVSRKGASSSIPTIQEVNSSLLKLTSK